MNPQPKLYHLIDVEGEKKLREVGNPHKEWIRKKQGVPKVRQSLWISYEQSAIANAKVLINPVDGKTEYAGEGLREVWQWYDKYEFEWRNNLHGDFIDYSYFSIFYKRNIESCSDTRQAFEYIGEKGEENEHIETDMKKASDMYSQGIFSLLNPKNPPSRKDEAAFLVISEGLKRSFSASKLYRRLCLS